MSIDSVDHIAGFGGIQRLRFLRKTNQLLQRKLAVSNKCISLLDLSEPLRAFDVPKVSACDCSRKRNLSSESCHFCMLRGWGSSSLLG